MSDEDEGVVYLLLNPQSGLLKIGYSRDHTKRIADLSRQNGVQLLILGLIRGDRKLEADLHRRFSSRRKLGEWFSEYVGIREAFRPTQNEVAAAVAHAFDGRRIGAFVPPRRVEDFLTGAIGGPIENETRIL